jgi:uncharacterized membrane protein YhfC
MDFAAYIKALNELSPLGLAALLTIVIFMQVRGHRKVNKIESNDLHQLPEMLATLQRIEVNQSEAFATIITSLTPEPPARRRSRRRRTD